MTPFDHIGYLPQMLRRRVRECKRCRGRGSFYEISPKVDVPVVGFNPIGGFHLLLHLEGGSVSAARHYGCCRYGGNESTQQLADWAQRTGFRWPEVSPRPLLGETSGCIENAR